jgi:hypothetical protein
MLRHFPQATEACGVAYEMLGSFEEAIEILDIATMGFRDQIFFRS